MYKLDTLLCVIQCLNVVLGLRKDSAQLKLYFAFLANLLHACRHTVFAVEFIEILARNFLLSCQYGQALLEVDKAFIEHSKSILICQSHQAFLYF